MKNIEIGKKYWFIGKGGVAKECKIIKHNAKSDDNVEHWIACPEIGINDEFKVFHDEIFGTKEEASIEGEKMYEEYWNAFKDEVNSPEKFMNLMIECLTSDLDNTILFSEEVEEYAKEKIKEYFDVNI